MDQSKLNVQDASTMPGMLSAKHEADDSNEIFKNYTVKYFKADLDEPDQLIELQRLETLSILAEQIVLTDRKTSSDAGRFYVILRYLEKRP